MNYSSPPTIRKTPSPNKSRLNSPRGSPRSRERSHYSRICLFFARNPRWFLALFFSILLATQLGFRLVEDTPPPTKKLSLSSLLKEKRAESFPVASPATLLRAGKNLHMKSTDAQAAEFRQKEEIRKRWQQFDPSLYPVLPNDIYVPHSKHPLQVVFVGTDESMDPTTGVILDGLDRSKYIQVARMIQYDEATRSAQSEEWHSLKTDHPLVYVIDWENLARDCHVLERVLVQMAGVKKEKHDQSYLLYVDLSASASVISCPRIEKIYFAKERIRQAKRSIVENRYWDHTLNWVHTGKSIPNHHRHHHNSTHPGLLLHAPLVLPESFVFQIDKVKSSLKDGSKELATPEFDVAHLWRDGDNSRYGFLRRKVASTIAALNETTVHGRRVHCLVKGIDDNHDTPEEFYRIRIEYLRQLLSTKIVVVAQQDEWEDHAWLMEAFASGALVMTDAMLALPSGMKNRSNVVIYDSPTSLEKLVRYYLHPENEKRRLNIAQKGWELAMTEHRSWVRMEVLLFGKIHTQSNKRAPSREHKSPTE
jgi:hypothetical protein